MESQDSASILPDFLGREAQPGFVLVAIPGQASPNCSWHLAWNPRMLRLNAYAARHRDWLAAVLAVDLGTQNQ
jgi:DNA-binding transcriptional LysR family regulator